MDLYKIIYDNNNRQEILSIVHLGVGDNFKDYDSTPGDFNWQLVNLGYYINTRDFTYIMDYTHTKKIQYTHNVYDRLYTEVRSFIIDNILE